MQDVTPQDRCSAERLAEGQCTDSASAAAAAAVAITAVSAADVQDLSSVAHQLATL